VGVPIPGPNAAGGRRLNASAWKIELLGEFLLWSRGQVVELPGPERRVLAFVALQDRPARRTRVAGELWPDLSDARAMGNLRSALWRIRRTAQGLVRASGTSLSLVDDCGFDVRELTVAAHALIERAGRVGSVVIDELSTAGELLPDWSDEWLATERERFRQLRLHALETLSDDLLAAGRFARAVEVSLATVALEPLRESAQRLLIRAYLAEGNRSEAVRQFRAFRALYRDELGLEPAEDIAHLVHQA
jgi:DNA-binding SARP family transcriptional activator